MNTTPLRILSLCTGAGLWDKALVAAGHDVVAGCEIVPHKREAYRLFVGGEHLCEDLRDLAGLVKGQRFDGIIGGIPCQSRSKLRAMRVPKFGDLIEPVVEVLARCDWTWFLFENVAPLDIPGSVKSKLNAQNFGRPHQSRERWFTHSPNLHAPPQLYPGGVDDLLSYPVVAGRIYGAKRGALLQGWPEFAALPLPSAVLQEALADGVPRCLADAWIPQFDHLRGAEFHYA